MENIKTALWYLAISLFLCFLPASTMYNGIRMAIRGENPFLVILVLTSSFITSFIVFGLLHKIIYGEDKQ